VFKSNELVQMKKLAIIIGGRPQYIKAGIVLKELSSATGKLDISVIDTGQHYDFEMSQRFVEEFGIPVSKSFSLQNASFEGKFSEIYLNLFRVFKSSAFDAVLVFGDTNSTLAAALAAKQCGLRLYHVEAGLRSDDFRMPEETNRVMTDSISNILYCPTDESFERLSSQLANTEQVVIFSGDVMFDGVLSVVRNLPGKKEARNQEIDKGVLTLHRNTNTDDEDRLNEILSNLILVLEENKIVFPLHPRLKAILEKSQLESVAKFLEHQNLEVLNPLGYEELIATIYSADFVITDSGGVQKEAYFLKKPTLILRNNTEWKDILSSSCRLYNSEEKMIFQLNEIKAAKIEFDSTVFGDGRSAEIISRSIIKDLCAEYLDL